jgi:hypothetical protein
MVWSVMPTDCLGSTTLCYRLEPIGNRKSSRIGAGFGMLSAVRVPTSVPTGADRHTRVPTCADRDRRGQRLRGAVPPVPRDFVGTKFAVRGYSEMLSNQAMIGPLKRRPFATSSYTPAFQPTKLPSSYHVRRKGSVTNSPGASRR